MRSRDKEVCRKCTHKTCVKGNEKGYGCPWLVYPGGLDKNSSCGLCLECIKTCAYDNTTLRLRNPGIDLLKKTSLDEAFKGFIMLGAAGVYTAAYFGWWNSLKDLTNFTADIFFASGLNWTRVGFFALLLGSISLIVIPGLHLGFTWLSKKMGNTNTKLRELFVDYAYYSVPLGFMSWAAFVVGMLMINSSYIAGSLSDPLGFGWDLFGAAELPWAPFRTGLVPFIQLAFILVGSIISAGVVYKVSVEHFKDRAFQASLPVALEISLFTTAMVFLTVMP